MPYRPIPEEVPCLKKSKYFGLIGAIKILKIVSEKLLWLPWNIIKYSWLLIVFLWDKKFDFIKGCFYFLLCLIFPFLFCWHQIRIYGGQPNEVKNLCSWFYNQWEDEAFNHDESLKNGVTLILRIVVTIYCIAVSIIMLILLITVIEHGPFAIFHFMINGVDL